MYAKYTIMKLYSSVLVVDIMKLSDHVKIENRAKID